MVATSSTPSLPRNASENGKTDLALRLSRNIVSRRRCLGLTQAQLAERLGVETETLSRFERGKHLPSLLTLERLSGLLVTSMGELLAEQPLPASDEALVINAWLANLQSDDRAFAQALLKQCCDYLASRKEKASNPDG